MKFFRRMRLEEERDSMPFGLGGIINFRGNTRKTSTYGTAWTKNPQQQLQDWAPTGGVKREGYRIVYRLGGGIYDIQLGWGTVKKEEEEGTAWARRRGGRIAASSS